MQCSVNIATDIPVFVRISYSGSTAVRLIDDISVKAILSTITYSSTPICGIQKTTVSFDSNGGAGTVPAQIKEEVGKTVTLPNGDGLSKEGFTFSGWNTKADGTGTAYVAEATYAMTAENVTLHAQWTAQEVEPPYGVLVGANPTAAGSAYVDGEEDKEFDQAGAKATITATANPHYRFHDWTIDEGNVIIADAKAATTTITVQKEKGTVLYANFVSLYPITTTVSGEGTISVVNTTADSYVAEAAEGDKMEVSVTTDDVVKLVTMNGTALTATNGKYTFTMPRGAVTIEATIVEAVKWYVVHDMSLLNAGDQMVFAYEKNHVAGALSEDYLKTETATFSEGKNIINLLPENATIFTLGGTEGAWTFANRNKFLNVSSKSKLENGTTATTWNVQITDDGVAQISAVAGKSSVFIRYNLQSPRFAAYTSTTQKDIRIFTDHKLSKTRPTAKWYADATHTKELTEVYAKQSIGVEAYFVTNTDGATTFVSSDASVATIDGEGNITLVGIGTTTITATTTETENYLPNTASFSLNVLYENACVWKAASMGGSNKDATLVQESPVSIAFAKNGGSNAPKYYADDSAVRFYQNNTITISGENKFIVDIKVVFDKSKVGSNFAANIGIYSVVGTTGQWSGVAKEVVLTNSGSRSDIVSIEVHYLNTETVRTGLTEGKFGTICLDKNVTTSQGASFYEIAYREDQNGEPYKVNFDEVKTLEAGVPYIFLAEDEQITVVYGDETAIAASSKNGLVGTFAAIQDGAAGAAGNMLEGNYLVNNNQIRRCLGNCSLPANRAYIRMDEVTTNAVAPLPGRRRVTLQNAATGTATGWEGISEDSTVAPMQEGIYDVLGRKLENAESGFYIINGKKQVIVK